MNKTCEQCGELFEYYETRGRERKYCNDVCRRRAERERYRQTDAFKLFKAKQSQRRNEREKAARVPRKFICQYCGKEFEKESKRGANPKYCNPLCRQKQGIEVAIPKQHKRLQIQKAILTDKLCRQCNKPLTQYQVDRGVTFCSQVCFAASTRTLIGTKRVCVVCGKDFEPRQKGQKCCDNKCAKKQADKTKSGLKDTSIVLKCVVCGQDFHPYVSMPNQMTCSKYCKRRRDSINKIKSGYRASVNRRRQLVISATTTEPINRAEIFERDGWVCQVCKKKVNPNLSYPHPMSASLDHILPFALGGSHTKANVQLAHLRCNIKKSDSGGAQLRLIGGA